MTLLNLISISSETNLHFVHFRCSSVHFSVRSLGPNSEGKVGRCLPELRRRSVSRIIGQFTSGLGSHLEDLPRTAQAAKADKFLTLKRVNFEF